MKVLLRLVLFGLKGIGVIIGLLVLLAVFFILRHKYDYYYGFDQQEWVATGKALQRDPNNRYPANAREHMASDVAAHYLAPGMSRQEVIALLGPPEWQDPPMTSTRAHYLPRMQYYVWTATSDVGSLTIVFNPRGQVVRYSAEER
jgi:hypothetical protein